MTKIDTSTEAIAADLAYLRSIEDEERKSPPAVIHDRYLALAAERDRLRDALQNSLASGLPEVVAEAASAALKETGQ